MLIVSEVDVVRVGMRDKVMGSDLVVDDDGETESDDIAERVPLSEDVVDWGVVAVVVIVWADREGDWELWILSVLEVVVDSVPTMVPVSDAVFTDTLSL